MRIGDWLVNHGLLSRSDVDSALAEQRLTGDSLGQLLVARGVIDEEDLSRALAGTFGLPYRDLAESPPAPEAMTRLPQAFCRRRGVLPVAFEDGRLILALTDPADVLALDDAQVVAGCGVDAVITTPGQLRLALDRAFSSGFSPPSGAAPEGVAAAIPAVSDAASQNDLRGETFVEHLLDRAVEARASDVHLEPSGTRMRVRLRVDGVLHDAVDLSPTVPTGTVNRLKVMTGLDIAEHRRPQDGRMSFVASGRTIDARVATLPTVHGEALTLRILDRDQGLLDVDRLGFDPDALGRLRASYTLPWGLILAVGPTGSGKSTTIYSILNEINDPCRNVITIEDPVEYDIAGIKQTQVHDRIGYTFAAGLRSILRSDPDVIVIGEIRDTETAHTAAEAALTGHLVLSTLHANDASTATARLLEMDLEPYLVASSLTCVVAQRLVRRLCPHCRRPYEPEGDELLAITSVLPDTAATPPLLPLPEGGGDGHGEPMVLYAPGGCQRCNQTGYFGRVAVYEVMRMTSRIRTLVLERSSAARIQEAATADGMQQLRENGVAKVIAGVTSFAELARCIV
jgi:type IV pilus assembly protein PilB